MSAQTSQGSPTKKWIGDGENYVCPLCKGQWSLPYGPQATMWSLEALSMFEQHSTRRLRRSLSRD